MAAKRSCEAPSAALTQRENTMNDPTRSQSQRGFDPDEPEPQPLEVPPETPEADALEQRQAAAPDDVDDEFEAVPAWAWEADALEQSRVVPFEDAHDV
jgi:hypothetical protein